MLSKISLSFKIAIAYLVFGILWILISDTLTNILLHKVQDIQSIQLIKGWFFIFFSTLFLYFLSKKLFKDLHLAKNQVNEAKILLENIINNAPIRIFWKNKEGIFLGANKAFLDDMNLDSFKNLIGKKETDFDIKRSQNSINDDSFIINNNSKKLNYIQTIINKDGTRKILNTSKVPLLDKEKNVIGVIGVYSDITQEVEIENQIKKQESMILMQSKFSSMGEMIAHIVHQWRQPLNIISTSATGIKVQKELGLQNSEFEAEALDIINENVQYLSKTIDDFRNFFKEDKLMNSVHLNVVINKTLSLISSRLKDNAIKVETKLEDIVFETLQTELTHVLINIINNAIDAFEKVNHKKYIFIQTHLEENIIVITIK
ncbi:MAG: histidine kinase dimerization/phospho-acceptor domain-containing protein, partial [Arcobacteraceae bacterium]